MNGSGIRLIHLLSLLVINLSAISLLTMSYAGSYAGATTLYDDLIGTTARRYGLEPAFIRAVVKCESNFDPSAVSSQGAQGLMQLMPATQATLGVLDPFNPPQNIDGGSRYFAILQHTFGATAELLLAAYNAGPQAVITAGYMVPNIPETKRYIDCVNHSWKHLQTQGFNQQYAHIPTASNQPNPTASPVVAALQAPPADSAVGQRLLLHLNAWNMSSDTVHGVVSLTYPETHFSLITLRTTAENITIQLPRSAAHTPVPAHSGAASPTYRFLQSAWPAWEAGQQRTASLVLVPLVAQDIALHLSVLFYDRKRTEVQHRWSTVVRIPVKSN